MENQKQEDVGSSISNLVQNAIDKQDFSQLSQTIQNTMKTYTAAKAQNPWKGNGQFEKKTVTYMSAKDLPNNDFYSNGGATRAGALLLCVLGGVGCFGFGTGLLIMSGVSAVLQASAHIPMFILFAFLVASIFVLWRGLATLNKIKRFKNYVRLIGNKTSMSLKDLSDEANKSQRSLVQDLRSMMQQGMFKQAHIDKAETTFFLSDAAYASYKDDQQAIAQKQADAITQQAERTAYKNNAALSDDVKKTISEGQEYIDKIHASNDAIKDENVSKKLDDLETIITKIFKYVEEHPDSAPETKKLMKYYLPTTIKLLDAYQKLGDQPAQGENILSSKKEIEDTLDTLNQAFARLFDNLYQDTSMDITSDISVLNTLLAQEGLTGEKMNQEEK